MEKKTSNKPTKFSKGQVVNVRYSVKEGKGHRAIMRDMIGYYEIVRTGKRFYLFDNDSGIDWYPTKEELEQAIANF